MQNRGARTSKNKMINFDDVTNENKTEHNPKWPYIPDHSYRILIIGDSGSGKTIEYQEKDKLKQLKSMKNKSLNLIRLLKMILILPEVVHHMENKEKHLRSL